MLLVFFFCKHEAHDAFSFYNDTNNKINIINCNLIFFKNQRFEMKIKNKKKNQKDQKLWTNRITYKFI
jgi:hypothetical protein